MPKAKKNYSTMSSRGGWANFKVVRSTANPDKLSIRGGLDGSVSPKDLITSVFEEGQPVVMVDAKDYERLKKNQSPKASPKKRK